MTRKDYETLAAALKRSKPSDVATCGPYLGLFRTQWTIDCEAIAQCIAKDNRAFDVNLFLRNCGVEV